MTSAPQYVTLVVQGGTPVRLADQKGAPYPTTGRNGLVFSDGPLISNPTFTGRVINQFGDSLGLALGTETQPALFFGPVVNNNGFYSSDTGHVNVTINGEETANFASTGAAITGGITYSTVLNGVDANFSGAVTVGVSLTGMTAHFVGAVTSGATIPLSDDNTKLATTAWVRDVIPLIAPGGGGGGGGDDLDTTPVAATGSTLARTMPDWLAGAPIVEIADDVLVAPDHRGVWLHMLNAVGSYVYLPDDWPVGMAFGVRQIGTGTVQWITTGDATLQLPFTRNTHVGISEQYEEVVFRVIANSDGAHAIWGVSGATA